MNIFKYAVLNSLRVPTSRGNLSAEQLAQLPVEGTNNLRTIAINLATKLEQSAPSTLDFLDTSIEVDVETQAQFDLVKEIIKLKQTVSKAKSEEAANKTHNAKIDAMIAAREQEEMASLSVDELKKLKK